MSTKKKNLNPAQAIDEAIRTGATSLDLQGMKLQEIPASLRDLAGLKRLNVSRNLLTSLPEWLGDFENLEYLDASQNQLTSIPNSVGNLGAVRILDFSFNRLVSLPSSFSDLNQLQELILFENQLTQLGNWVGNLRQLNELSLSINPIEALPDSLGMLRNLRSLTLSATKIRTLPETFQNLKKLRFLALGDTEIQIPEWIGSLTALEGLDVSKGVTIIVQWENKRTGWMESPLKDRTRGVEYLPISLTKLTKLKEFYLHGNAALELPSEVLGPTWNEVRRGPNSPPALPAEILKYYFRVKAPVKTTSEKARPLLEARIIIIGDGAAGKTSLVRQLLHSQPARNHETSTKDVVIEEWVVRLRGTEVRVNVWDFGGQKQMHAAHPYFFTTRTLYLIVAEARKDQQDRVEYWLKMVAKYGENARAIVVINKADPEGHAMALDRPKLLDRYRNNLPEDSSRAFFPTSCTAGTGITEVRNAIERELERMDQLWALWPGEWFRVKEAIAAVREPNGQLGFLGTLFNFKVQKEDRGASGIETLNYDDWRRICEQCGVSDENDRDNLLEHLGHLGRVVCFPRNARLRQLGVLNPEWVTRGIYPLLVESKLAAKGGMITASDLSALLPTDRYPKERHPWLIDLMKAFELVFEDDQGRLLLPGLLPMDSPVWAQPSQWEDTSTLHLELRYDVVLPESVISQFIVRRHKEARVPGEWWRHGIALKRANCQALVRAHTGEKEAKIELRLRGPRHERRDFLASIRETLRDPKDSTPPELHVILGNDCAPKYLDLLIHASAGKAELDFIVDSQSVRILLAPMLDMIETPAQQIVSREAAAKIELNFTNENNSHMSNKTYVNTGNISGGAVGDGNTLTNTHSFNAGTDLKEFSELITALRAQTEELPTESQTKVKNYIEQIEAGADIIATETKKTEPNRGLLTLTKSGILNAAKCCADIAPSLLKTANTISQWVSEKVS